MRIVSGTYKSRQLVAPKGTQTRPTTDRVREALMSTLTSAAGSFDGMRVLDAFAGSGALGLEALSRGAAFACFCDTSREAVSIIKKNIATLAVEQTRARVQGIDVLKATSTAVAFGPYDLVFLDPPYAYDTGDILSMVDTLDASGALEDDVVISYEHDSDVSIDEVLQTHPSWYCYTRKKYGDSTIDILMRQKG